MALYVPDPDNPKKMINIDLYITKQKKQKKKTVRKLP